MPLLVTLPFARQTGGKTAVEAKRVKLEKGRKLENRNEKQKLGDQAGEMPEVERSWKMESASVDTKAGTKVESYRLCVTERGPS